jgi:hypothetical protein
MTARLLRFFVLWATLSAAALCQVRSPSLEQRAQIIKALGDPNPFVQRQAVDSVIYYQMTEIVPLIEGRLWREQRFYELLRTLELLHAPSLWSTARALSDSAESIALRRPSFSSLALRVLATEYLFRCGDYSTVQDVFAGYVVPIRDPQQRNQRLLREVIMHVPAYADSARNLLVRLMREGDYTIDRWNAMYDLVGLYGRDIFPEIVYVFVNDASLRFAAIVYLFKLDYPGLHDLLADWLSKEPGSVIRMDIADSLLTHYGTPEDYRLVSIHLQVESTPMAQRAMARALEAFTPPVPAKSLAVVAMLDSAASILQRCASYGWIAGGELVLKLTDDLQRARQALDSHDSIGCAVAVKRFQGYVDFALRHPVNPYSRTVTMGGWKFLHYNAQHILDRLPAIPLGTDSK